MKATIATNKLLTFVKFFIFTALTTISIGASAAETMYVGNPMRENTFWVPGHCRHGVYIDGYYVKVDANMPVRAHLMKWVVGHYDRCGNYVQGHWWYKPMSWHRCGYWSKCGYWHRYGCYHHKRHHHRHHHHKYNQ